MAVFIPNIKIETVNNCNDLKITDSSVFTEETPKTLYDSRTVTIEFTDGTSEVYDFPLTPDPIDILTIENFSKGRDYYITVTVRYDGEISEEYKVTKIINHVSTCNAIRGRSKLLLNTDCGCDPEDQCTISKITKLDTSIENTIYAASFNLGVIAQKFADQSLDIVKALEDCNCK